MIQFNLLPDIKLEYIKTKRTQRLLNLVSIVVAGALLTIAVLLFMVVNVFQKEHLKHINNDIKDKSAQLQKIPDLDKILTIQNQLSSLPGLHDQKPVASRLFAYLSKVTPATVPPQVFSIAKVEIDFANHTILINGDADSIKTVNKFVDTLKFTTYSLNGAAPKPDTDPKAFSNIVLSSFTRDDKSSSYTVNFNFAPEIFDITKFGQNIYDPNQGPVLTVPNIITTRSATEKPESPTSPFKTSPNQEEGSQ
jgi:hypothetical protein